MAYFVLEYRYGDMEARARARSRHLEYVEALHAAGKVVLAGPVGDGSGALVVYRVADEAEAQRLIDEDPYTTDGVSVERRLRSWDVVIPSGGTAA